MFSRRGKAGYIQTQGQLGPLALRNRHLFFLDIITLSLTPLLALLLRLDGETELFFFLPGLFVYTFIAVCQRPLIFYRFGLYRRYWRYASEGELILIGGAVIVSTLYVSLTYAVAHALFLASYHLPRSIPILDSLLVLVALGASRFSVRLTDHWRRSRQRSNARRVLIMGAGDAGSIMVRELQHNPRLGLEPVGFVDDDAAKHGMSIHNVPVLGNRLDIPQLARNYKVDEVIIAMPTAPGKVIREIVDVCEKVSVQTRIIPGIYALLDGSVSLNQLRHVEIEDLLRREPVQTDGEGVCRLLRGRRVLVTGGGGSIGSELCRQVLRCDPAELIIVGHGENSVFEAQNELRRRLAQQNPGGRPPEVQAVIADVRFPERIEAVFRKYRPQVVFHAAAHKHVHLMELNPSEAITNNVLGTRNVLNAALATGVERFVMISTDKAVNPTGMMGASKRAAELLVHRAAARSGRPYVAVRFGNVLGSRGSVVQVFKNQIANGGPVTVTHPEMKRYFMTIPEAVQLVLQAAVLGKGGEVFVLNMGEPVRIVDLARDLIELSGLEVERDIDIVYTGLRPGEKMYEELFVPGEKYEQTCHDKIFIARCASDFVPPDLEESVEALAMAAQRDNRAAIVRELKALIPEYQPPETPPPGPTLSPNGRHPESEAVILGRAESLVARPAAG
ncbi:MAG: nucleoside-diphosphate sugar epimerase/dehydratase [Chloroflexota bacterium]